MTLGDSSIDSLSTQYFMDDFCFNRKQLSLKKLYISLSTNGKYSKHDYLKEQMTSQIGNL